MEFEVPFEGEPTEDELLAGAVAEGAAKLNELMRAAAEKGVRTNVLVEERYFNLNKPAEGAHTAVYINCYRREEVRSVIRHETLDLSGKLDELDAG